MNRPDVIYRARKGYRCDDACRGTGLILPGELYTYCTSPPWDDIWATGTWDHIRICNVCLPVDHALELSMFRHPAGKGRP